MAINTSVQYNGGLLFSLEYNGDPRLLPSGNSVKYYVEAWLLQPMKQYIITTRFDDMLHSFRFVFAFVW